MTERPQGSVIGKKQPKPQAPPRKRKEDNILCEIDPPANRGAEACVYICGCDLLCPIVSEANNTDHWTVKRKRKDAQKIEVNARMSHLPIATLAKHQLLIRIIRIGGRKMDGDNYQTAVKAIRDSIASQLRPGLAPGQADSTDQFLWDYHQQSGKPKRIRIEFWKRIPI